MALEILKEAPSGEQFTPLSEHQSQTPGTFFGGKPVLHLHSPNAQLLIARDQLESQDAFKSLYSGAPTSNGAEVNGEAREQVQIPDIDVWVTSENLILFSQKTGRGLSLAYPSISLHAIQRLHLPSSSADAPQAQGLYMQLALNDTEQTNSEDDVETLEITLVPSAAATTAASSSTTGNQDTQPTASAPSDLPLQTDSDPSDTPIRTLFAAVSACADLHPDPASPSSREDDAEGSGGMPGGGGWITAENMHEYFDEEGQFVGGEALGAGAGTVHHRDEGGQEDGGEGGEEEVKWQRTE